MRRSKRSNLELVSLSAKVARKQLDFWPKAQVEHGPMKPVINAAQPHDPGGFQAPLASLRPSPLLIQIWHFFLSGFARLLRRVSRVDYMYRRGFGRRGLPYLTDVGVEELWVTTVTLSKSGTVMKVYKGKHYETST